MPREELSNLSIDEEGGRTDTGRNINMLITYKKKFLESDWLRAKQFQANTVPKIGNSNLHYINYFATVLLFCENSGN